MSEGEEVPPQEVAEPQAGEGAEADAAPSGPPAKMGVKAAIQEVLRKALARNGLSRGLHETVRALEAKGRQRSERVQAALLVILAEDCDQPDYKKLITALCEEKDVNLLKVSSNQQLGEWCGLCKYDDEGNARKVVSCSAAAVTNYGEESQALSELTDYLKEHQSIDE